MRAPLVLRGCARGREVPPKCACGAEVGGVGFVGPSRTWVGAPYMEIWGDPCFTEESPEGRRDDPHMSVWGWGEENGGCCQLMARRGRGLVPPTSMGAGGSPTSMGL